ncbi:hypothetical protein HRE53_20165 [Acaryochloris sp. 'Moss Beach']|uniref:hypothetical protein n=1 Tax=Acaryochloris sp. 'Moss Beach' TaxID=2740837 RepID=UPI001F2564A1|nr:hypothetical protein [Acaryochloris sp. 'Moss Beach']UJB68767.1 hypothetical protein HRE53_20165 [Acaryochloris sp. 'Moss Beach']
MTHLNSVPTRLALTGFWVFILCCLREDRGPLAARCLDWRFVGNAPFFTLALLKVLSATVILCEGLTKGDGSWLSTVPFAHNATILHN